MGYYRRKKRPSQYRFLKNLYPSVVAIVILFALDGLASIPCGLKMLVIDPATCKVQMPSFLYWWLAGLFLFGIVAAGYRYYRDFHLGEYWVDLEGR